MGGRTLEIPAGDLINSVYQNLNILNKQLDPSFGAFPDYPSVDNQTIPFLREKEQNTYLRMTLPIFNPALNQGKQLQAHQVKLADKNLDLSKQSLSYEVKKAYLKFLKIAQIKKVLIDAKRLVTENLKTAESLYKYHQVTQDYVYSAKAEVKSVEKELVQLHKQQQVAEAYFNNLLNQPLFTPIQLVKMDFQKVAINSLKAAIKEATQNRLELNKIDLVQSMSNQQLQTQKATYLPTLNLVGQYGIQGTNYAFNNQADYAIGSLVLSWTIFEGDKKHKIEQSKINQEIIQQQKIQLQQQIELEVLAAFYEVETAEKNKQLVQAQNESVAKAYQLVAKKFKQGQANLIEITNARTQLTRSEQAIILAEYDYRLQLLALDKAMGR